MGARGQEGKYGYSALPSLAGAAARQGKLERFGIWGEGLRQLWCQASPALSLALVVWLLPG